MADTGSMPNSVAQVYAEALLTLARQANVVSSFQQELEQLGKILDQPELMDWLTSPVIGVEDRLDRLEKALRGRVSDLLCDAILVIVRRGRLALLPGMIWAFRKLAQKEMKEIDVDVYSAVPLSAEDSQSVMERLAELLPVKPIVHEHVQPDLLGGLVVKIGDRIIDASVRHDLREIREKFLRRAEAAGRPKT